MKQSYFPDAEKKSILLNDLFKEYDYKDLAMAFFCISIKRENRSMMENSFSLNKALLNNAELDCGTKRINSYQDFILLFDCIKKLLPRTYADDYTTPDFGEVRVIFDGIAYKTFIGTGHTQPFACLSYIEAVAEVTHKKEIFRTLLEYQNDLINYFEDVNDLEHEEGIIEYEVPSESLFLKTVDYFNCNNSDRNHKVYGYINDFEVIEQRHFVEFKGEMLPLFNTSLIIDAISEAVSNKDDLFLAIKVGIYNYINRAEEFGGNKYGIFVFPGMLYKNKSVVQQSLVSFAIKTKEGLILCLDIDSWEKEKDIIMHAVRDSQDMGIDVIEMRRRPGVEGSVAIHVNNAADKIKYIVYYPRININEIQLIPVSDDLNVVFLSSLDLMDILMFSDDVNEIWEYMLFTTDETRPKFISFSGHTGEFLAWKESGHYIEKGSMSFSMVNLGYNEEVDYVWDYYKIRLKQYPWGIVHNVLFEYPTVWRIDNHNALIVDYSNKYAGYRGQVVVLGNVNIFFCNNAVFYKDESVEQVNHLLNNLLPVVEDILFRMVNNLKETIRDLNPNEAILVQVIFMPERYYDQVTKGKNKNDYKYVLSDSLLSNDVIHLRYKVREESLIKDIQNATNRVVECDFVRELLRPIWKYSKTAQGLLNKKIDELSSLDKQVGVFQTTLSYIWNPLGKSHHVNDDCYLWARKRIALIFSNHGIEQGEYYGKEVNRIIRVAQESLIPDFESLVCEYSQYDLQLVLMSEYSVILHNISIHIKRYALIDDIQDEIKKEVRNKIISEREELKHQKRVIEYLMETNLFLNRNSDGMVSDRELCKLIAYANWLVILSDNADICYFTNDEVHAEISFENVIDIVSDKNDSIMETLQNRIYDDLGYITKGDEEDKEYYLKAKDAFNIDTGISFDYLIDFLGFLSSEISDYREVQPNVFSVKINSMLEEYLALEGVSCPKDELESIIGFLTVMPEKLKTCNGKEDFYLPIGKRNERDDRIDVKCLWRINDSIIYSPVMTDRVKDNWFHGFIEFFLPYTKGLSNTVDALNKWKNRYEKQIVLDVEACFKERGYKLLYHNFDPKKMNISDEELRSLGDYDVLVIDDINHKIWMIECKMLSKVASFFDMYMQQQNFFINHKNVEHFQRRINYMRGNYHSILEYLGCNTSDDYEIFTYMVINKVMLSRYKKLDFECISFSELKRIIPKVDSDMNNSLNEFD